MSETCGDNTDWTALPGRGFLNYNKTHSLGVLHRDDNHKTTTATATMMTITMPIMVTATVTETATVTATGETEKLRTKKVLYAKCPTTSYLKYRTDLNHSDWCSGSSGRTDAGGLVGGVCDERDS
ncbi:hypothetical protein TWF192_003206 [Orbilia oligospora]|uniref:Uncharacterized protein n=1 Tax=Orbilia oligospora TaxID=2813651 RepID=A0A6G1ME33_ORBOL|nr:hypothetical protein TWF679_007911 [Orbilia oligospora]KAF3225352.1 hypothetical protein TWF191_005403 [Orbilia oligospora]KAF3254445.1 hypothetical protein TWF192_003206 [Orbilia oligospora]